MGIQCMFHCSDVSTFVLNKQKTIIMKKTILLLWVFQISSTCFAQNLGGYQIVDFLVEAYHPNCDIASHKYAVGEPNDSLWVNIPDSSVITGYFGSSWLDGNGSDFIIESGYNTDDYDVRMILSDSSFSDTHNIRTKEWISLDDEAPWTYFVDYRCNPQDNYPGTRQIIPLDFDMDFGLTSTDTVIGIEIMLLKSTINSASDGDFAGVYITDSSVIVNTKMANLHNKLSIYPNPAKEYATFEYGIEGGADKGKISIYNVAGQLMQQLEIDEKSNATTIPLQNLKTGLYWVELTTDLNRSYRQKLMVK